MWRTVHLHAIPLADVDALEALAAGWKMAPGRLRGGEGRGEESRKLGHAGQMRLSFFVNVNVPLVVYYNNDVN